VLPEWFNYRTHAVAKGTTQSGKSKFAEHCMREHVLQANGFCLLDWHGTLYDGILEYLAYLRPQQPVILINPSQPDFITPFNPFRLVEPDEVTAHAGRLADVLVKSWGAANTNELPTYERVVKMVITFAAVSGEPLHHCARLLEMPKKEHREYAISIIEDDYIKQQWKQLQYIKSFKDWVHEVQSTQNRLARFVGSKGVKLFTGLPGEGLRVDDAIERGAILLVNLKPSGNLSAESGKVFAGLLLSEFLNAALRHTDRERPYFLYCDEAQNYLTPDAAGILDQVVKAGLRVTLLHHHEGQFYGNVPLIESIRTNARIKLIFGGLTPAAAKESAEELFLPELNERWKKDDKVHYITQYDEEQYETITDSSTSSSSSGTIGETETQSSGDGSSHSVQYGSRLRPRVERIVDGQEDWSHEEKISKLAERLTALSPRHCYVKLPDRTYAWEVPWVEPVLLSPDTVLEFIKTIPSTPLHEAEEIIRQEEARFLKRTNEYERGGSRPKKKPPTLHPQR
jgi:hypothetical protein